MRDSDVVAHAAAKVASARIAHRGPRVERPHCPGPAHGAGETISVATYAEVSVTASAPGRGASSTSRSSPPMAAARSGSRPVFSVSVALPGVALDREGRGRVPRLHALRAFGAAGLLGHALESDVELARHQSALAEPQLERLTVRGLHDGLPDIRGLAPVTRASAAGERRDSDQRRRSPHRDDPAASRANLTTSWRTGGTVRR